MSDRPLTLAIEGLGATEGATDGAGRYLTGLLTALGQRSDVRSLAYVGPSMRETVYQIRGLDRITLLPTGSRVSRIPLQHLLLPALAKLHGADVVVYPNNYVPAFTFQPTLAIVQNMFLAHPKQTRGRVRAVYRRCMRSLIASRAHTVIAVSSTMARELERADPRLAGSVQVVYPPLDIEFFRSNARPNSPSAQPYFLAVGTLWRHRKFDLALRALARTTLPHRLVIAGATPTSEVVRLQSVAQELGVGDRLQLLGVVPPSQMPSLYSGAAALIATSELESFGMSLVEAMAAATPIVAVRRTVYEETVGNAGLLVEPHPEALARAMVEVTKPTIREQLIANGDRRAGMFTFSRYADRLIDICRACAADQATNGPSSLGT